MKRFWESVLEYLPWASVQQITVVFVLQSLALWLPTPTAIMICVVVFVLLHVPNLLLMGFALLVESIFLVLYAGPFALLWMVPVHAIVAVSIKTFIPEDLTHDMKVLWEYRRKK